MYFVVTKTTPALVSSRLDYCNSRYLNIALKNSLKLRCVHNCLTMVVIRSPHFSHSVPHLKSLHWLPQAFSSKQPAYLHSLLTPARQPRHLRTSNSNLLFVPSVKTNVGTRAFSVATPTLWNSVPVSVKSVGNITTFRGKLKTYPFKLAYPP